MSPRRAIPVSLQFLSQTSDVAHLRVVRAEDSLVRYVVSSRRVALDVDKVLRLRDDVIKERGAYAAAQRALKRAAERASRKAPPSLAEDEGSRRSFMPTISDLALSFDPESER